MAKDLAHNLINEFGYCFPVERKEFKHQRNTLGQWDQNKQFEMSVTKLFFNKFS